MMWNLKVTLLAVLCYVCDDAVDQITVVMSQQQPLELLTHHRILNRMS